MLPGESKYSRSCCLGDNGSNCVAANFKFPPGILSRNYIGIRGPNQGCVTVKWGGVPCLAVGERLVQCRIRRLVIKRTRRILSAIRIPFQTDFSDARQKTKDLKNIAPRTLRMIVSSHQQSPQHFRIILLGQHIGKHGFSQAVGLRIIADHRVPNQFAISPAAEYASAPSIAGNLKMPSQGCRTAIGKQPGTFRQFLCPEGLEIISNFADCDLVRPERRCRMPGPSSSEHLVGSYGKRSHDAANPGNSRREAQLFQHRFAEGIGLENPKEYGLIVSLWKRVDLNAFAIPPTSGIAVVVRQRSTDFCR